MLMDLATALELCRKHNVRLPTHLDATGGIRTSLYWYKTSVCVSVSSDWNKSSAIFLPPETALSIIRDVVKAHCVSTMTQDFKVLQFHHWAGDNWVVLNGKTDVSKGECELENMFAALDAYQGASNDY